MAGERKPWERYTTEPDRIRVPSGALWQVRRITVIHLGAVYGGIPTFIRPSDLPDAEKALAGFDTEKLVRVWQNAFEVLVDGVVNEDTDEIIKVPFGAVDARDAAVICSHALRTDETDDSEVKEAESVAGRSLR